MSRRKSVLHKRMKQMNVSNHQLAQYAMINTNVFNLWLDSKAQVPISSLIRISELLDIDITDLLDIA